MSVAAEDTLTAFLVHLACASCAAVASAWGVTDDEGEAAAAAVGREMAERFTGLVLALRDGSEVFEPEELEALIERNAVSVAAATWPHRAPKEKRTT